MKALELISTLFLVSGCGIEKPNPMNVLKDFNEQIQRVPAQGTDPNNKPLDLPVRLTKEELETTQGEYADFKGTRLQVTPSRMAYPFIDGASAECRRLTEEEMQVKRNNPEKSITCIY